MSWSSILTNNRQEERKMKPSERRVAIALDSSSKRSIESRLIGARVELTAREQIMSLGLTLYWIISARRRWLWVCAYAYLFVSSGLGSGSGSFVGRNCPLRCSRCLHFCTFCGRGEFSKSAVPRFSFDRDWCSSSKLDCWWNFFVLRGSVAFILRSICYGRSVLRLNYRDVSCEACVVKWFNSEIWQCEMNKINKTVRGVHIHCHDVSHYLRIYKILSNTMCAN